MQMHALPRLLLVEDDPVSRAFLAAAAAALPARVDSAASLAEARALVAGGCFDAWLIDANLPDGSGVDLLRELRAHTRTPALAHTAASHRVELDALIAAGFDEALVKPVTAAQLQHALRRLLQGRAAQPTQARTEGKLPAWDHAAAEAAVNGNAMQAWQLRALFLAELPAQRDAVIAAFGAGDEPALRSQLHRLHGSCGFVAARRLEAAVRALRNAPSSSAALEGFITAVEDTLVATSA